MVSSAVTSLFGYPAGPAIQSHDEIGLPMHVKADSPLNRAAVVRLLVLIPLMVGILVVGADYIKSLAADSLGSQAGTPRDVQVIAGSEKMTLRIAVTSVRPGSIDDLNRFDIPAEDQDKIPHYIWFRSKITSGSLHSGEPFPITVDQWEAVSSGGETLQGIPLGGDLQPCPQISNQKLSAGEADEGCFMVFNEAGNSLTSVSLHLVGGESIRWRF